MKLADQITEVFKQDIFEALIASEVQDEDKALEMVRRIYENLQNRWGGTAVYIQCADKTERNKKITEKFNGRNHYEICREFGISISTLRRVTAGKA